MTEQEPTLDVVIRLGDRSRTVPPESLAAVLRLPSSSIRMSLARLLFASSDQCAESEPAATREPTEGVGNAPSETLVSDVPERPDNSPRRERCGGERRGSGEGGESPPDAMTLADALDDHAHLAALEALVAQHPASLLRTALTITLARPASSIQSTRGAYFTGVLRRLAGHAATPPTTHA